METTSQTSLRYIADKGYIDSLKNITSYLHITDEKIILTDDNDDINHPREQFEIKLITGYKKGKRFDLSIYIYVSGKEIKYRVHKKDEIIAAIELKRRDIFKQNGEELPILTDGDISINKKTFDYSMVSTQELSQNGRGNFWGRMSKTMKFLRMAAVLCLVIMTGILVYQYFSVEDSAKTYAVDNSEYWVATYSDYFDLESYFYQKCLDVDKSQSPFYLMDEQSGESMDGKELMPEDFVFFAKVAAFCARSNDGILYKRDIRELIDQEIKELNTTGDEILFGSHYTHLAPNEIIIDWLNNPTLFSQNIEKLGYDFEKDMKSEITIIEIEKNKEMSRNFGDDIKKVYDVVYAIGGMRGFMKCRISVSHGEYGPKRRIDIISQSENYEDL